MTRRVVVTGIGLVTPLGSEVETVWQNLLAGKSGVDYITHFDASRFPTKIAAEVKNWDLSDVGLDPKDWVGHGFHTQFAMGAGIKAVKDSGIQDTPINPLRFGIYTGSGEGQQNFDKFTRMMAKSFKEDGSFDMAKFVRSGIACLDPIEEMEQEPNMPSAHLASYFDAEGPNANCLTACAASSQAVGEAVDMIRRNEADIMLAGGTHTMIHPFGVSGFNLLTALSTNNEHPQQASRPFENNRDGFVLGEGSGMLVLEEYERAKARGAKIYGELIGYGSTCDAYRITDIHPDGRGAIAALKMAFKSAGIEPKQIDYINAHGTSTHINDQVETIAIKSVFGEDAYKVPMSSTKSMVGHLIAAAGATELIYSLLAMRDNIVPPTINYVEPDPLLDLDYVPNVAREKKCDYVLSNSFGFGGQDVSLIAKKI